jgi:hypothetical protein
LTELKIFIEKYNMKLVSSQQREYQYEARNISSYDQSLEIPSQLFALPESPSDEAILTKAEGNTERITFSWIIKEEDTSPIFNYAGTEITSFTRTSDSSSWSTLTTNGQMVFFLEVFEKIGMGTNDKHRFVIWDDTNNKNVVSKYGSITRISMQKSATDPATWNAMIDFAVGDVITVSE